MYKGTTFSSRHFHKKQQGYIQMDFIFKLPKLLEKESFFIENLPLSCLLLKNDERFLWMILVPRRSFVKELIDLDKEDQQLLLKEINIVSQVLQEIAKPDKLNIGIIGNIVPELHVHVVARYITDSQWPKPVWGNGESVAYSFEKKEKLLKEIRQKVSYFKREKSL